MPLPIEQANSILQSGANGLFDIEEQNINGVPIKVWKSAPANLQQVFENTKQFFDRDYLVYADGLISKLLSAHR